MPYKIYKEGGKYCVHKKMADDSKGEKVPGGCHGSLPQAQDHMRALYSNVDKAKWQSSSMNDLPDSAFLYIESGGTKDESGKTKPRSKRHLPYKNASGKIDLPHLRNAISRLGQPATGKGWMSEGLRSRLLAKARKLLSGAKKERDENIIYKVKELLYRLTGNTEKEKLDNGFLLFKEKSGRLRFFVRYSNKFRDDDYPVKEIISDNSHRRFDEMVDKGISKMPEMWLWHVPEWKFGVADWHAYDDSGFAMASGLVDEGKEPLAIWLSKQKGVRTSHGMPPESIVRDPEDPSVIIAHETVEISALPKERAANPMTGFLILGNESKETGMAIPTEKLQDLVERWGADPELLEKIQEMNEADAELAKSKGIESKEIGPGEKEEEPKPKAEGELPEAEEESQAPEEEAEPEAAEETEPVEAETEPAEDADEVANKATGDSPTRDEIAEAVVQAVKPIVEENRNLANEVAQLRKEVSHLKERDDEKIEKAISETPPASIGALIASRLSTLNSKETEIDGRTSLAKSKPKENEDEVPNHFGIPFIDQMVFSTGANEESQ